MSEFVSEAQKMTASLVSKEIRGGDTAEGALRRVASKCGVSYHALWQLRYRAPKRIFADVYFAIREAYEATLEQQARRLEHEIRIAEARGIDTDLARSIGGLSRVDPT